MPAWLVPAWLADDPPAEDSAGLEAEGGAVALLPPPPAFGPVDAAELAEGGPAAGAGAAAAGLAETVTGMEDKASTESVAMGDRPS